MVRAGEDEDIRWQRGRELKSFAKSRSSGRRFALLTTTATSRLPHRSKPADAKNLA